MSSTDPPIEEGPGLLPPGDRVVMISGASRGLGAAIARRLHADGFRLSLGVRDPGRARGRLGLGPEERVLVERFDATEPGTAGRWVDTTIERFGRLDGLVNNAGILRQVTFDQGSEEVLDELWQVNVKGPFRLLRLTLPHLRVSGHGRVVNVASTDAKRYRDPSVSIGYAMAKHALLALSHAAKFAAWEHGVRVTALCPGAIDTELLAGVPGVTPGAQPARPGDRGRDREPALPAAEHRHGVRAGGQHAARIDTVSRGTGGGPVPVVFDGRPLLATPGQSLAALLTGSGILALRETATGAERGLFCGMGVCQECLVVVDGVPNQRACMLKVTRPLTVSRQTARTAPAECESQPARVAR